MEVTPESYERIMDVNMRGTLYMTQAVVPQMRAQRSGSIVNMSSVSAQRGGGVFGGSHYAAAKAAILGYTKAAARELGPDNIRVNALCPSYIDTDIAAGQLTPERMQTIIASVPMGRPAMRTRSRAACCSSRRTLRRTSPAARSTSMAAATFTEGIGARAMKRRSLPNCEVSNGSAARTATASTTAAGSRAAASRTTSSTAGR